MNILYLSVFPIASTQQHDVYADISHAFARKGHTIYTVTPLERRSGGKTHMLREGGEVFLRVRSLNNQKCRPIEKMLALHTTPNLMYHAIRKNFSDMRFDIILYDTPFLRLGEQIAKLKKQNPEATTYLLLKDIWPQSIADLNGIQHESLLYRYFEKHINKLYALSDRIGCLTERYAALMKREYALEQLVICPLCADLISHKYQMDERRKAIRRMYGMPEDAVIFVYGGNFGEPQGINFLLEALEAGSREEGVYFALLGSGTEYGRIQRELKQKRYGNVMLREPLAKKEYYEFLDACDVGMVFLNRKLTVPNMPSRTLDYMQCALPILAAVDEASGYVDIIEQIGCGRGSIAGDISAFIENLRTFCNGEMRRTMGDAGRAYFEANWTSDHVCDIILNHINKH